jgi:hypothetical protein
MAATGSGDVPSSTCFVPLEFNLVRMTCTATGVLANATTALSFRPLIREWERVIAEKKTGTSELYQYLLDKIREYPELLEPIHDLSVIEKHAGLIEQIMATIFPVTLSNDDNLFAVSVPLTYQTVYSSDYFRKLFIDETNRSIVLPDERTEQKVTAEKRAGAFQLILQKFYGVKVNGKVVSVYPFNNPHTGLDRFLELEVDSRFIDVHAKSTVPKPPDDCLCRSFKIHEILDCPSSLDWLKLEDFEFEGIAIVNIRDVTSRESINNIKNSLLTLGSYSDVETFSRIQREVQSLLGVPGLQIGITPFFNVNNHLVFSALHNANSVFLKNLTNDEEKHTLSQNLQTVFSERKSPVVIHTIDDEALQRYSFLYHLQEQGWKGIIIYPLFYGDNLIGTLEVISEREDVLSESLVLKLEPAISLFELAVKKSAENLDSQIDKVIKDQFTAIQRSVEWRFTEAALNYLTRSQQDEDAKVESIIFDNVYPLYGAIDIRNSSTERNHAIQLDMLEQLEMAGAIIKKARKLTAFPLLEEIDYKIKKYSHSVSNIILSDEELSINQFLKDEIVKLFNHIRTILPSLEEDIAQYFTAVTSVVDMLYHHRRNFDESITHINKAVAKFIDKEQQAAQDIYPHYFERFVTDGVDFNIYIGQSISPNLPFDDFYLKNLKIWQLTTLAKAAQLSKELEQHLEIPLQTTQLILAHSHPISISFRTAERKFDVDGAYNIRYEIIKKRIDKVHIRDSNERLTQPGKIAIVYSQPREANEYLEYIEYLQNTGILVGEIERFELEELQGVSGLKALRIAINVGNEKAPTAQHKPATKESRFKERQRN